MDPSVVVQLLLGGLLAGGLGLAALEWSGSFPYFWQTLFHGNQGYYAKLQADYAHRRDIRSRRGFESWRQRRAR